MVSVCFIARLLQNFVMNFLVVQDAACLFGPMLCVSTICLRLVLYIICLLALFLQEIRSEVQRRKMQCMNRSQRHEDEDRSQNMVLEEKVSRKDHYGFL